MWINLTNPSEGTTTFNPYLCPKNKALSPSQFFADDLNGKASNQNNKTRKNTAENNKKRQQNEDYIHNYVRKKEISNTNL